MATIAYIKYGKGYLDTSKVDYSSTDTFSDSSTTLSIKWPKAKAANSYTKNNCSKKTSLSNRTFNYNWYVNGELYSTTTGLVGKASFYHTFTGIKCTATYEHIDQMSGAVSAKTVTQTFTRGDGYFSTSDVTAGTISSPVGWARWLSVNVDIQWRTYSQYVNPAEMWYTTVTLPTPTKLYYVPSDSKWYKDEGCTQLFGDFGSQVKDQGYNFNGSITLNRYTRFNLNQYTVHFDPNGGEGEYTATKVYQVDLNISSFVPTRDGYVFKGWARLDTAEVAEWTDTLNSDISQGEAEVTIYAVWAERSVRDYNGEEFELIESFKEYDGEEWSIIELKVWDGQIWRDIAF